jgi:hypothetical protein
MLQKNDLLELPKLMGQLSNYQDKKFGVRFSAPWFKLCSMFLSQMKW